MTTHPPDPRTPQEILEQMYAFHATATTVHWSEESAADLLFLYADNSFWAGQFDHINEMMEIADLSKLGIQLGCSILVVSSWAKPNLPSRAAYLERLRAYLALTESPERIKRLTQGLE